jgi:hypothetical protein
MFFALVVLDDGIFDATIKTTTTLVWQSLWEERVLGNTG